MQRSHQERVEPNPDELRSLLPLPDDSRSTPDTLRFKLILDALIAAIAHDIQGWQRLAPSPERREAIGRVLLHSADTFGSAEKAERWLRRPHVLLGGVPPLEIIVDRPEAVDAELTRIDHGVYA
jgi:uncharacterized protein (DUF2384 family)